VLNTTAGASSSYTLSYSTYSSGNSTATPGSGAPSGAPDQQLMQQYLVGKNTFPTNMVSIGGLSPNTVYDLYLYAASYDGSNGDRASFVNANGQVSEASGNGSTTVGFVAGDNYVRLTPMSNSTGIIAITQTSVTDPSEVDMNGLQIVAAAETFTQTSQNSDGTGTNFWSNIGNWNTGSPAGAANTAIIPASSTGT